MKFSGTKYSYLHLDVIRNMRWKDGACAGWDKGTGVCRTQT
jgi:hypothetical protein